MRRCVDDYVQRRMDVDVNDMEPPSRFLVQSQPLNSQGTSVPTSGR